MITLLKKIFIKNWQRKLLSLVFAIIVWLVLNHSITTSKKLNNVSVKVINLPMNKTIEGIRQNNILQKDISITVTGSKNIIENLTSSDIEIEIDAQNKRESWIEIISKKNLRSKNPLIDIDIAKSINKVSTQDLLIKLSPLVTAKIPLFITLPIGEPPPGYRFERIWPNRFYVTVSGPQKMINQLKEKKLRLTFDLNKISQKELKEIQGKINSNEVSFPVPSSWKEIKLPFLSSFPIKIDDPKAQVMRIDFTPNEFIPLKDPIPVSVFYPLNKERINPKNYTLTLSDFIKEKNGIKMVTIPLFAKGVSQNFLDIVKNRIEIIIMIKASEGEEANDPIWCCQFICPQELENSYVDQVISKMTDKEVKELPPHLREEYIRTRFRDYMNKFRLYTESLEKLSLDIEIIANEIKVTPKNEFK